MMKNIILSGCSGKMGNHLIEFLEESKEFKIVAGLSREMQNNHTFPIFTSIYDCITFDADVIIDFSHPYAMIELIDFAVETQTPILIGTTGFDKEQLEFIKESSEKIAIFLSANMSIGANLLTELSVYTASQMRTISDIDIIEKHHKYKLDIPSGTAIMIDNAIHLSLDQPCDINIHSIRSGGIYGEHQVQFASQDETITITHTALSRTAFVRGAIEYANFIATQKTGLFSSLNTYTKIK